MAIPYVLQNGVEISSHADHKGREYGTVTFAAPVLVDGQRGNMAVVVKQTTGNTYKVHRILTPDGSVFNLSDTKVEAEPTPAGESPKNGSHATPISSASDISIPTVGENVNGNTANAVDSPGIKGTGAAEYNFDGKASYYDLLSENNAQPDRPDDIRPIECIKPPPPEILSRGGGSFESKNHLDAGAGRLCSRDRGRDFWRWGRYGIGAAAERTDPIAGTGGFFCLPDDHCSHLSYDAGRHLPDRRAAP